MTKHLILIATLFSLWAITFQPTVAAAVDDDITASVRKDVETTLDLWRDGRFEEVYRRTKESGGHSKEYFIAHLAAAPRKPACCWEKLQEVTVTVKDGQRATLTARFGFDSGVGAEFTTRSLKLERGDGVWKVSMTDVLSLAGKSKKVRGKKKS